MEELTAPDVQTISSGQFLGWKGENVTTLCKSG